MRNRTKELSIQGTEFESQPLMDSREIAELTGKDHRNVCRDIVDQLGQLEGGMLRFEHTYRHEQNGQEYRCFKLPFRETMILVSGYSVELRAKVVDRWMELENRKAQPVLTDWEKTKEAVSFAIEILKPADSGKVLMLRRAYEKHGMPTDLLPGYTEGEAVLSATALLAEHNAIITTIKFNRIMESIGFLEKKTRASKTRGTAEFWSLTQAGLEYGQNMVSDKNQRETQPLYYTAKFGALLGLCMSALAEQTKNGGGS